MRYLSPLVPARFLAREKRFTAFALLEGGQRVAAHCANPGSMATCVEQGARIWLSPSPNPDRKLAYTWELSEMGRERIMVHPSRMNRVVEEALRGNRIAALSPSRALVSEARFDAHTRFDFRLQVAERDCLVEVKSVTLSLGHGRLAFPDARTTRGQKHLESLARARALGQRAVLVFGAARSRARSVECAHHIDPAYTDALRRALDAGVEILAFRLEISLRGLTLGPELPFLPP